MTDEERKEFLEWVAKQPKPKYPDDYVRADTPSGWALREGWREQAERRKA